MTSKKTRKLGGTETSPSTITQEKKLRPRNELDIEKPITFAHNYNTYCDFPICHAEVQRAMTFQ